MLVFAIGGGIAGLAGCLFTNWGGFISPTVFGLSQSAQIIIFVLVGGLGTLVGPILGAVAIEYLITLIGSQQTLNADLMLGVVLVAFVLLVPQGVVPVVRGVTQRLFQHRRGTALGEPQGRYGRDRSVAADDRPDQAIRRRHCRRSGGLRVG